MDVTSKTLEKFRESLAERGLAEGTQRLYVVLVRACAEHPRGITARLIDDDLAAKSRRSNRAALLSWASFTDDDALAKKVKRIKLPPPTRAKPKIPFDHEQWRRLVKEIRTNKTLDDEPAIRAALLLVAMRGIRMSDALRVRRVDVMSALRTDRFAFFAKGQRRIEHSAGPVKEALVALSRIKEPWVVVEDLLVSDRCKSNGYAKRHTAYIRMDRALRHLAKKCGIRDVHGHRFRRTYATAFIKALGPDPLALQKLVAHVGWTSITTASGYIDAVNREELDKVGADLTNNILG
jgi:integrase